MTGEAFQGYRLATHIAFDKTGTLTAGRPGLREVVTIGEAREDKLLAIAAAAESASEHPLAAAVMAAAMERQIKPLELTDFIAVPGRGVRRACISPYLGPTFVNHR